MINTTEDKKKIYKARTVAAKQMDKYVGTVLEIDDVVQFETTRETGEEAISTVIFTTDGDMYATLSPTVDKCIESLAAVFEDVRGISVKITNGISKSGNKFLQLDLA